MTLMLRVIAVLVIALTAIANAQEDGAAAHARLDRLLVSGQVDRLIVLHVPSSVQTRVQINERSIRTLSPVEFTFLRVGTMGQLDELKSSMQEVATAGVSDTHEARWAVLIMDVSGKELAAIFLDSSGKFLQVGNAHLRVQGHILSSLKKMIYDASH